MTFKIVVYEEHGRDVISEWEQEEVPTPEEVDERTASYTVPLRIEVTEIEEDGDN